MKQFIKNIDEKIHTFNDKIQKGKEKVNNFVGEFEKIVNTID